MVTAIPYTLSVPPVISYEENLSLYGQMEINETKKK